MVCEELYTGYGFTKIIQKFKAMEIAFPNVYIVMVCSSCMRRLPFYPCRT
jgi:hypothetical protein